MIAFGPQLIGRTEKALNALPAVALAERALNTVLDQARSVIATRSGR
ncbi:hypothetical protein ACLBYD_12955 [Rhodococcus sp. C26F]